MGGFLEQVHDRRAYESRRLGDTEQLEPGGVRVHQDAFLDLGDRIIGALEHHLELAAVILRCTQGAGERALEPEGPQFARNDGLQAIGLQQRHRVACALAMSVPITVSSMLSRTAIRGTMTAI